MKNRFSILAFFFCAIFSTLPAQETWVSDPAPTYFKGVVTYKVSYSGKLSYAQKRWLPDSMVIQANAPYIRIQFFGGMSDTLMQDVLWNSLDKNYLLIDHAHKYAYYPEVPSVMPTPKRSQIKGNQTILGQPCKGWSVTLPGESNQVWLSENLLFPLPPADSGRAYAPIFFQAGLKAIPLKIIRSYQGVTITTEATAIKALPQQSTKSFRLPKDYKRVSFAGQMKRHPLIQHQ